MKPLHQRRNNNNSVPQGRRHTQIQSGDERAGDSETAFTVRTVKIKAQNHHWKSPSQLCGSCSRVDEWSQRCEGKHSVLLRRPHLWQRGVFENEMFKKVTHPPTPWLMLIKTSSDQSCSNPKKSHFLTKCFECDANVRSWLSSKMATAWENSS